MRPGKGNQGYEEYEEDAINSKRDDPSSYTSDTIATGNTKDKNSNTVNATRSKHSATEQRRRSKINERFQILRDLVPNSNQKRDTASFLLEVIDHVKYLQETVQKYEGSHPGWSSEPTKLTPWRNSHWHVQTLGGQPHATKSVSCPVSALPGKFEENNASIPSNVLASTKNTMLELETGQEVVNKSNDLPMLAPTQSDGAAVHPLQGPAGSDLPSMAGPSIENLLNQPEDLFIEGGRISISNIYSQGLLTTLTDALQTAGVDLSQARISVQIDLGNRANKGQMTGTSTAGDQDNFFPSNPVVAHATDAAGGEEGSEQAQKRQKT